MGVRCSRENLHLFPPFRSGPDSVRAVCAAGKTIHFHGGDPRRRAARSFLFRVVILSYWQSTNLRWPPTDHSPQVLLCPHTPLLPKHILREGSFLSQIPRVPCSGLSGYNGLRVMRLLRPALLVFNYWDGNSPPNHPSPLSGVEPVEESNRRRCFRRK